MGAARRRCGWLDKGAHYTLAPKASAAYCVPGVRAAPGMRFRRIRWVPPTKAFTLFRWGEGNDRSSEAAGVNGGIFRANVTTESVTPLNPLTQLTY